MTWSALNFHGRIICYEICGEDIQARELGSSKPYPVTDELRGAIAATEDWQRLKNSPETAP